MHKLDKVLLYLQQQGSASKKEIRTNTFYDNVGDGIKRLRDKGHNIATTWGYSSKGEKYAIYVYLGRLRDSDNYTNHTCGECKFFNNEVCINSDSEFCADFVLPEDEACPHFTGIHKG